MDKEILRRLKGQIEWLMEHSEVKDEHKEHHYLSMNNVLNKIDDELANGADASCKQALPIQCVISRALKYSFLPKWVIESKRTNERLITEIYKTRQKIGKKEAEALLEKLTKEAIQQKRPNSEYIIDRLRAVAHGL